MSSLGSSGVFPSPVKRAIWPMNFAVLRAEFVWPRARKLRAVVGGVRAAMVAGVLSVLWGGASYMSWGKYILYNNIIYIIYII
jgi:hypothetical protein